MDADDRTALAAVGRRARLEQLARYRGLLIALRMHRDMQKPQEPVKCHKGLP